MSDQEEVVVTEVQEEPQEEVVQNEELTRASLNLRYKNLLEKMGQPNQTKAQQRKNQSELRKIQRDESKLSKQSKPKVKRTVKQTPLSISKYLASFLGVDRSTKMTRGEVTKGIWAYIRKKELKTEDKGAVYKANKKIAKLFGISEGDTFKFTEVTGFISKQKMILKE